MNRIALRTVILAAFFATSAIAEEIDAPALTYSPWSKFCVSGVNGMCFTGSRGSTGVGCASTATAIAATLVDRAGEAKKTLGITLQRPDNTGGAVRLMIDQNLVGEQPYARCFVNGRTAEFEAGTELVDQLKHGQWLIAEAVEDAGSINPPIRRSLPLLHFSETYDGPGLEPKAFVIERGALEKELLAPKERAEREKRDNEERKARCGYE
jgi:invasion protein IalB